MKKLLFIIAVLGGTIQSYAQITDTGTNVGIGTTTPSHTLDLSNKTDIRNTGLELDASHYEGAGTSHSFIQFKTPSYKGNGVLVTGGAEIGLANNDGLFYFTRKINGGSNSSGIVIDKNANVGIGTTSPNARLTIEGSNNSYPDNKVLRVKINGESKTYKDQVMIDGNINSPYGIAFGGLGHHRGGIYAENVGGATSGKGDITLWARSGGNINLDAGSVGIGTTYTKGFKLGVNGKVAATEVKIATYANWADFVFEKSYRLPTLTEVENHIKEKGHLKDIPSAAEVKKDGFFLGEMDAKLLQKIEELTLYTIQQEKQLKRQSEEIEELKLLLKKLLELKK